MEMQIKIETKETAAGAMHDLVLVQGNNTIRLGLVVDDAQQALRELSVWLDDNTMDVAELVNGEVHAEGGEAEDGGDLTAKGAKGREGGAA